MYPRTPKEHKNPLKEKSTNEDGDYIVVTIPEQTHLSLSSPQIFISLAKTVFLMF